MNRGAHIRIIAMSVESLNDYPSMRTPHLYIALYSGHFFVGNINRA